MTNATGIDVSSFQAPLTPAVLAGLDFVVIKATEGLSITDPDLAANHAAARAWGGVAGFYHEFVPGDDPAAQASYCYQAVTSAGGLAPGNFAAVVASDYAGTTGAEIAAWCGQMRALAGPRVPVLVYSDLSVLPSLGACTGWPLWVAWPNPTPPAAGQLAPWSAWTFWQCGESGTDQDQFNGTPAQLRAWAAKGASSMLMIEVPAGGTVVSGYYLVSGGKWHHIVDQQSVDAYTAAGIQTAAVSAAEGAQLLADYPPGSPSVSVGTVTFPSFTVTPEAASS